MGSFPVVLHDLTPHEKVVELVGAAKLDVGIVSCPELLPDLWDLADDFKDALDELPDLLLNALEHVAVVISDGGREEFESPDPLEELRRRVEAIRTVTLPEPLSEPSTVSLA